MLCALAENLFRYHFQFKQHWMARVRKWGGGGGGGYRLVKPISDLHYGVRCVRIYSLRIGPPPNRLQIHHQAVANLYPVLSASNYTLVLHHLARHPNTERFMGKPRRVDTHGCQPLL